MTCWLFAETGSGGCDLLAVWLAQRQAVGVVLVGGWGDGSGAGKRHYQMCMGDGGWPNWENQ